MSPALNWALSGILNSNCSRTTASTGWRARPAPTATCRIPSGSRKLSDHRVMSPLKNDLRACTQCHTETAEWLRNQVTTIQDRTVALMLRSGYATATAAKLFEMTHKAQEAGKNIDKALYDKAKDYYEEAFYRGLYVGAENSVGFHNPTEALQDPRRCDRLCDEGRGPAEAGLDKGRRGRSRKVEPRAAQVSRQPRREEAERGPEDSRSRTPPAYRKDCCRDGPETGRS